MWLSKLIYTLLTLLCFWLQWDYTPTPLPTPPRHTQTSSEHFYIVARLKWNLNPFFKLYTWKYWNKFYPMMVAGVHTFIHKDISVDYDFQNTNPPTMQHWILFSLHYMTSGSSDVRHVHDVPTLASTWSLLLTTPGATLPVSPPSTQPGSSSRARAETSNNQVRLVPC